MGEGTARVAQDSGNGRRGRQTLVWGVGRRGGDTDDSRCEIPVLTVELQVFCPGVQTGAAVWTHTFTNPWTEKKLLVRWDITGIVTEVIVFVGFIYINVEKYSKRSCIYQCVKYIYIFRIDYLF